MKGLFITFEGGEGSGKSTQARLLADYLKEKGYDVEVTREPGGTGIGDAIRAILLDPEHSEMADITELLLFAAARSQNVNERIKPAIEKGTVIICDRFIDSTLAYQGYGRNFDLKMLRSLNKLATDGVTPSLTILFDIPVEIGLERSKALDKAEAKKGTGDRFEQETLAFHRRLRNGFLELAKAEPERFLIIEVADNLEDTHIKVVKAVEEYLEKEK
jgi:dTMP kinase